MTKKLKPADEIDAYCTRCKLDLAHRIIALDGDKPHKVECLTCRSAHLYRRPKSVAEEPRAAKAKLASAASSSSSSSSSGNAKPAGKSSSAKAIAAAEAENLRERDWERRVSGKGLNEFKPYRTTSTFNTNELIRHAKFGDGFVARVIDKNKIEVMFRDGLRTLAHGLDMG
jgi:hypothetical protein